MTNVMVAETIPHMECLNTQALRVYLHQGWSYDCGRYTSHAAVGAFGEIAYFPCPCFISFTHPNPSISVLCPTPCVDFITFGSWFGIATNSYGFSFRTRALDSFNIW